MDIKNPNVIRRIFGIDRKNTGRPTKAEQKIREYLDW